ncbi:MAG: EF2563 family selenium-dependent molybdenum hydroxylase system protein [Deltaproteobacteria bacterium]|nr:EF2563 family selenium-dependent molybdenum hydroxylase system protein [Deltaproteobacteria bacterium]MBI2229648.1 EF2563 family selenium-dependent molybdenum hydroxylase system protein [Deltaproteobacteria bacterium]
MNINPRFNDILVVVKGGGDLASGAAYRLKRSGFALIMTELPAPLLVRRTVCYGAAVYDGEVTVEGLVARRVKTCAEAQALAAGEMIPVLADPQANIVAELKPKVVVDAIMAKVNTGTTIDDAPLVVALGPGFTAGQDCHAVIETNRGHWLGRVIYAGCGPAVNGQAEPDTRTPGLIESRAADRVLRAPAAGQVTPHARIGNRIAAGQLIGTVNGHEIRAAFSGVLRGLVHSDVQVTLGMKIGDLDPRGEVSHCFTISDKSLAVGGGVLEAILASDLMRET